MLKKTNKKKNLCVKLRKNIKGKDNQSAINSTPIILNNKKKKKCLENVENNLMLYEIKPLSPTKLSISVKKFYNNNKFKQYEENLHLYDKNDTMHFKETMTINTNKNKDNKDVKHKSIINCEKNYSRPKKKFKNVNHHKPYDLNPQLNKEQYKKKQKSNKTKSTKVFCKEGDLENDQMHFNSLESQIMNETQTNEYLVEEYQVTKSTINALSISVKRFYKSNITSNDNEKVIKDMPLVSDTTFNSKADFNQSPLSSKLNNSHKISLNVKHINDTSDNKQQKVTAFFPIRRSARKTKNIVNEEKQIALEEAIASQNEDGLKVTVFPNKGRGIIAAKDFARGDYVVEYSGELIYIQEARKREAIYSQDISTGCYMYYFKYGSTHYCIDATPESSRLGRLVNHSRFGNLIPKVVEVAGLPRIVLIAKTDIKRDEELTYDYGDRSKKSLINHPWLAY
ncbi:histone-lysine N-methyltransferase, H3 lysine-4 specific isoform X1 [Aphis craccivora]|uniref:[histone H4]-lysine(20) N-methyltransferase n=1 Tax=Aphis craccivora TaxID=307492 RepID=A0A6G0Z1Q0_APHCR|nr:histone-lysine N-methyltransferase, H3 lysine-4 specific isoform X1 [Aphis craccivora]